MQEKYCFQIKPIKCLCQVYKDANDMKDDYRQTSGSFDNVYKKIEVVKKGEKFRNGG